MHFFHRAVLVFPPSLTKQDRALLHKHAQSVGLVSESMVGGGPVFNEWGVQQI